MMTFSQLFVLPKEILGDWSAVSWWETPVAISLFMGGLGGSIPQIICAWVKPEQVVKSTESGASSLGSDPDFIHLCSSAPFLSMKGGALGC